MASPILFHGCYGLQSINPKFKGSTYIGYTVNPFRRLRQHNGDITMGAKKTSKKRPWEMKFYIRGFVNHHSALQFEWQWQNPTKSSRLLQTIHHWLLLGKLNKLGLSLPSPSSPKLGLSLPSPFSPMMTMSIPLPSPSSIMMTMSIPPHTTTIPLAHPHSTTTTSSPSTTTMASMEETISSSPFDQKNGLNYDYSGQNGPNYDYSAQNGLNYDFNGQNGPNSRFLQSLQSPTTTSSTTTTLSTHITTQIATNLDGFVPIEKTLIPYGSKSSQLTNLPPITNSPPPKTLKTLIPYGSKSPLTNLLSQLDQKLSIH